MTLSALDFLGGERRPPAAAAAIGLDTIARLHHSFLSYFEAAAVASGAPVSGGAHHRASLLGPRAPGAMHNLIGLADLAPPPMPRPGSVAAAAHVDADGDVAMGGAGAMHCDADDAEFAGAIDAVESRIDDVLTAVHRTLGPRARFTWVVSPLCSPPDLPDRLERRGLEREEPSVPQMALRIADAPASIREPAALLPRGYELAEVDTPTGLRAWVRALKANNGYYSRDGEALEVEATGFKYPGLRRYSVTHSATRSVVATSALWIELGVAGIYCVSTHPAHRRRGLGSAVTVAALAGGAELGCDIAGLQATVEGRPLYERLGFRVVYDLPMFFGSTSSSSSSVGGGDSSRAGR